MKLFGLFILVFVALSCSHFTERQPNSTSNKPKHLIITVHGLSGDAVTFGDFGEVTKKHMSELTPGYEIDTKNFIYSTGVSEKNGAFEFAFGPQGLSQFIKSQHLNKDDKISFVCHSQGGIVTYLWFFRSILEQNGQYKEDYEYAKQVDSIITLGTPFWGSKIASILTDKRNPQIIGLVKLIAPVTKHEINDMAFGSDTIDTFRNLAIKLDTDESLVREIESLPVRLINITGILPQDKNNLFASSQSENLVTGTTKKIINLVYSIFTTSYKDNKRIESDIAVPVPSSRWNFIYTPTQYITQNQNISFDQYHDFNHLLNRSHFLFTESSHFPFDVNNTLSMAYIPKACIEATKCDHPTYKYVIDHLSNCKIKPQDCDLKAYQSIVTTMKAVDANEYNAFKKIKDNLESFSLQINIKLKPGTIDQFPVEYFRQKDGSEQLNIGYDAWELKEYSLLDGKVINLNTAKKSHISFASNDKYKIVLADDNEKHSVDIISRKANQNDPFDRIRIHITGRVENLNSEKQSGGYLVPVDIKLPGLPSVKLNTKVQQSYSTFTELDYTR